MRRASIPATTNYLETLVEPILFDPYDWHAMADRIVWQSLTGRSYMRVREFFDATIAKRTWSHVVDDHVRVLEYCQAKHSGTSAAGERMSQAGLVIMALAATRVALPISLRSGWDRLVP